MSFLYFYYIIFALLLFPLVIGVRMTRILEFVSIFLLPLSYLMIVFLLRDQSYSNDFTNYQAIYEGINNIEDVLSGHGEVLFYLIMYIGRLFAVDYLFVYFFSLLFFGVLFLSSLYFSDICIKQKAILLVIIFSSSGFYFLLANAFRQGLSLLVLLSFTFALSAPRRFLTFVAAPFLHFSSLFIIGLILFGKLKSRKFLIVILGVLLLLVLPFFDVLISYRAEKYSEMYDYESSFQLLRILSDMVCLLFLIYNRSFISFFWPAFVYIFFKFFLYDFAPLVYSRISYYDVVVGVAVYTSLRNDYKELWSLRVYLMCVVYAFVIFSTNSLSSNFERFQ